MDKFSDILTEDIGKTGSPYAKVEELFFTEDLWKALKKFLRFLYIRVRDTHQNKIPYDEIKGSESYRNLIVAINDFGESGQTVGKEEAKRYLAVIRNHFLKLVEKSVYAISENGVTLDEIKKLFDANMHPAMRIGTAEADELTLNGIASFFQSIKKTDVRLGDEGANYLIKLIRHTNPKNDIAIINAINNATQAIKDVSVEVDYTADS